MLCTAIALDVMILAAFLWTRAQSDILIVWISVLGLALIFIAERGFLGLHPYDEDDRHYSSPPDGPSGG